MRTRVKICGITSVEDAALAVQFGADALGFNLYPQSPRFMGISRIQEIMTTLPPFIKTVGLFVNATAARVNEIVDTLPFDLLQFHGDESNDFCAQFQRLFIKAIQVKDMQHLLAQVAQYPDSQGVLLDAHAPGAYGGTGQTLAWQCLPTLNRTYILAGGLRPENVAAAIHLTRPYAVDVSSGVEADVGVKDAAKMRAFFAAVVAADRSC